MKNMKGIIFVVLFVFVSSISNAQMPSLDEFLPPAEDEPAKGKVAPTEIQEPQAIKVTKEVKTTDGDKTPVVQAANAQDAINKAVEVQREFDEDITEIKVGSGIGVVARGAASYEQYPNRNATLLSQRQAYVKAYMYAKKNLAEYMNGLTVDAQNELVESSDNIDTDQDSLANSKTVMMENNRQKVEGMLKGFVIYKVDDNLEEKLVTVSIVTTAKTRGETMQANAGTIVAKDFRLAMKQVLAKLKTGVLPPLGGKVISVPTKNQLFFLGFGSEIIRHNKNKTVMRKNKQLALKIAEMRAKSALLGLITGDQTSWSGDFSQSTEESLKQFNEINNEDPMNEKGAINFESLEDTRNTYLSRAKTTDAYRSAIKGQLPPGLKSSTWVNGDWGYALYLYNPESTKKADKIRSKMQESSILKRGNKMSPPGKQGSSLNHDDTSSTESNNQQNIQQGASGQISNDDDL